MNIKATVELLDREHLNRLAAKPAGCRELIEAFITATEPLLNALDLALQQRDEASFAHVRHALTGAAMSTGAKAMAETCQALAHRREPTEQAALVDTLNNQFRQTCDALLALLATLPPETPNPTPHSTLKTILVVEDNAAVRKAVEVELSDGYRLIAAENGEMALALGEGERLNAAIVDLNLGFSEGTVLSGLDVIQRLKDRVPALVLTVDSSPEAAEAALRAGAWMFLSKANGLPLLRVNLDMMMARFEEAHARTGNRLGIATGLLMAQHYLAYTDAQRLLRHTATMQRRRTNEIVDDILNAHALHSSLRQMSSRPILPSDSSFS